MGKGRLLNPQTGQISSRNPKDVWDRTEFVNDSLLGSWHFAFESDRMARSRQKNAGLKVLKADMVGRLHIVIDLDDPCPRFNVREPCGTTGNG